MTLKVDGRIETGLQDVMNHEEKIAGQEQEDLLVMPT